MQQALSGQLTDTPAAIETLTALLGVALVVALVARRLRFPYTLALALVGLLIGVLHLAPNVKLNPEVVLFIFLPALLFEGAWNIETPTLIANWFIVAVLAGPGLLLAVVIAALTLHFGAGVSLLDALLLSAIISPTDPIAVIALLRQLGMSSRLRVIIEGESLFNDGVGAAVFTLTLALLLTVQHGAATLSGGQTGMLVAQGLWLLAGGPLIGLAIGFLVSHALGRLEDRLIETVATFLTAYGVYLIADLAHTSGLLAVVAAGLTLGSYGRRIGISEGAREAVENVWDFVAYVVTSLLFLLLGVALGASLRGAQVPLILWATLGVVLARIVMVYGSLLPYNAFARRSAARGRLDPLPATWQPLIVLSGLRGALSIALALSLPETLPQRDLIANVVYGVVLITLVGQGVSLRALLPRWPGMRPDPRDESANAA